MAMQFSTHEIRPVERFDCWHELICRTYATCSGIVRSPADFDARLTTHEFGAAEVSEVVSTGIRYERRPFDVRTGPRDDIFVSIMIEGETRFEQNGRQVLQKAGDILLYDSGRSYIYQYDGHYKAVLMRIPRPAIESRFVDTDKLTAFLLAGGTPLGRLLGSLLCESQQLASSIGDNEVTDFTPAMLDMIAAAIRQSTSDEIVGSRSTHFLLDRVKRYLRDNLGDSSLSLERIAKEQNVSVRTLSRLFAETGTTPIGWLQAQRLNGAYNALIERKARTVTDAALDFGFNDLSHFGRSFKKEFGMTPKSLVSERSS